MKSVRARVARSFLFVAASLTLPFGASAADSNPPAIDVSATVRKSLEQVAPDAKSAAAAREQDIGALVAAIERSRGNASAALRPKPGEDLGAISRSAKDGQQIVLSAGNYPGMLQIANKTLVIRGDPTGKTMLTGGGEAIIVVGEGGVLVLENVAVGPAPNAKVGIYVQKGAAILRRCSISNLSQSCGAEGGALVIAGCKFAKCSGVAIGAGPSSAVLVCDSSFADGEGGVVAQDAAAVAVLGCEFRAVSFPVQTQGAASAIAVRDNDAAQPSNAKPNGNAIQLDSGAKAEVRRNRLVNFGQAVTIAGQWQARPTVEENWIANPEGGICVMAPAAAGQASVMLTHNFVGNASGYAVLIDKGAIAQLSRNTLVSRAGGVGVALQANSGASLDHDDIYAPTEALALRGPAPTAVSMQAVRIVGPVAPGIAIDAPSRGFSLAVGNHDALQPIQAAAEKIFAALQAADAGDATTTKPLLDALAAQFQNADRAAASLGRLSLHLADMVGQRFVTPFFVYGDRGTHVGQAKLFAEDLKNPGAFFAKVRASADPVSEFLRTHLTADTRQKLDRAPADSAAPELTETMVGELNQILASRDFFDPQRFAKVSLSAQTTAEVKGLKAGSAAVLVLTANRHLLEDAFPAEIVISRSLAKPTADDPWASVPAGSYWLVPEAFPQLGKRVSVAAGESLDAEASASNGLVLNFRANDKAPVEPELFVWKPAERMRRALAQIGRSELFHDNTALPLAGATKDEIAAALALARRGIAAYSSDPTPQDLVGLTADQAKSRRWEFQNACTYAERILSAYGDESDLDPLIKTAAGWPVSSALGRMAVIAYIESRLGLIEHGRLLALTRGKDQAAAVAAAAALHSYGVSSADAVLVAYLRDPAVALSDAAVPAFVLLDVADPTALAAMRDLLGRAAKNTEFATEPWKSWYDNPAVPAMLYLLAYGDREDAKKFNVFQFGPVAAQFVGYLANDPSPAADFLIAHDMTYNLKLLTPALRDLPANRTESLAVDLENKVHTQALAKYGPNPSTPDRFEAERPWHNFRIAMTFWRPHMDAAELLASSNSWEHNPEWLPFHVDGVTESPWLGPPLSPLGVATYYSPHALDLLESYPRAEIIRRFGALPPEKKIFAQDLFLAAYRVCTRAFYTPVDNFHDGIERRPYLFRQATKGAICGVLEAVPSLSGRKLALTLRQRQSVFYIKENMYDSFQPETLAIHQYAKDGGRGLIGAVRVMRGDKIFPVHESPAENGTFLFEADLDRADLAGVYVDVEFKFFDQALPHAVLDLFASDAAKALRRGTTPKP